MRPKHWTIVFTATALLAASLPVAAAAATDRSGPSPSTKPAASGADIDRSLGNGLCRLVAHGAKSATNGAGFRLDDDQDALTIRDSAGRVLIDLTPQAGVNRAAYRAAATKPWAWSSRRWTSTPGHARGLRPAVGGAGAVPDSGTGTIAQASEAAHQHRRGHLPGRQVPAHRQGAGEGHRRPGHHHRRAVRLVRHLRNRHLRQPADHPCGRRRATGDLPGVWQRQIPPARTGDPGQQPAASTRAAGCCRSPTTWPPPPNSASPPPTAVNSDSPTTSGRLADKAGACGADVIVDDVAYYSEPFFSDGVVSDAVDEVAGKGVSYFPRPATRAIGTPGRHRSSWSRPRLGRARQQPGHEPGPGRPWTVACRTSTRVPGVDVAQTLAVGAGGGYLRLPVGRPVRPGRTVLSATRLFVGTRVRSPTAGPEPSSPSPHGRPARPAGASSTTDAIPRAVHRPGAHRDGPDGTDLGEVMDTGTSPRSWSSTIDQVARTRSRSPASTARPATSPSTSGRCWRRRR